MGILGTIFVAAIGTVIGTYFQDRSDDHKRNQDVRSSAISTALEIFSRLSKFSGAYLNRAMEVCNGYELSVPKEDLENRWKQFQEASSQWEEMQELELTRIWAYFGKKITIMYGNGMIEPMDQTTAKLNKLYYEGKEINLIPEIIKDLEQIDYYNHKIGFIMIKMILNEKVGILREDNDLALN